MDRFGLARSAPSLDVLIVDDIMRTFSRPDIASVRKSASISSGCTTAVRAWNATTWLILGVDVVLPATTPPAELVALIGQSHPARPAGAGRGRG